MPRGEGSRWFGFWGVGESIVRSGLWGVYEVWLTLGNDGGVLTAVLILCAVLG